MKTRILLSFAGLSLALSACTSVTQDPFLTAATGPSGAPPISAEISPQFALASLPPSAGRTVSVQQVRRETGIGQTVIFANRTSMAGDNALTVEVSESDAASRTVRAPTRAEIRKEMAEVLPGVVMRIDDVIGDNAQGVFGYALGASGRGHCLYGWQVVKSGAVVQRPYSASIRLRFCDPSMSEAELVSMMQGLRLLPVSRETVAMLRQAPGRGYVMPASIQPEPVAEPAPVRRSRPRPIVATAIAPVEEAETASVSVPLPGGSAPSKAIKPMATAAPVQKTAPAQDIRDAATVPLPQ